MASESGMALDTSMPLILCLDISSHDLSPTLINEHMYYASMSERKHQYLSHVI
jgi:hypothetical protein